MRFLWMMLAIAHPAIAGAAASGAKWEVCLDKADFNFSVDGFMGSLTAKKDGCSFVFGVSGGKGERYILDICDPKIHIDYYNTIEIDPTHLRRVLAGTAGCSAPLFGADFDENARDYQDYKDMRKKLLDHFAKVKLAYGEGSENIDLSKPSSFNAESAAGKIACGQFLLKEYLENCASFEAKKVPQKEAPEQVIPGVHPKTILVPVTK